MKSPEALWPALLPLLLVAACASTPLGPTVQVFPAPNKPFPVFQQEQEGCKQYAQSQVAGQADAANKQAVGIGVLSTVLGGALGAAAGGHQGAGVGAAGGAVIGTAAGGGTSTNGQYSIQGQYNNAYLQCMYSKGNQVPGIQPTYQQGGAPPPGGAMVGGAAPSPSMDPSPPPGAGASMQMTLAQAQAKLNAMGFAVGQPDGVMGRKTKEQLTQFQKSRGIPETGELDAATIGELNN